MTLQLTINYPENLPDFFQKNREEFVRERSNLGYGSKTL